MSARALVSGGCALLAVALAMASLGYTRSSPSSIASSAVQSGRASTNLAGVLSSASESSSSSSFVLGSFAGRLGVSPDGSWPRVVAALLGDGWKATLGLLLIALLAA